MKTLTLLLVVFIISSASFAIAQQDTLKLYVFYGGFYGDPIQVGLNEWFELPVSLFTEGELSIHDCLLNLGINRSYVADFNGGTYLLPGSCPFDIADIVGHFTPYSEFSNWFVVSFLAFAELFSDCGPTKDIPRLYC